MVGVAKQIIGSFEDLGKQVGGEVVKAPAEIAGKALESLGAKSQKTQGAQAPSPVASGEAGKKSTPLDELDQTKDKKTREAIAHAALEYLAGKSKKQKEPSVWERMQEEEQKKKEQAAKQVAQAAAVAPVFTPSKPKRGNLYGIAQKASIEKKTQVRQD